MKILALNSSPRGNGQSKTGMMLSALVDGMRAAGAEVDEVSMSKKTIKPCAGCFSCWTKTPGNCIQKDDMSRELFPQWLESDLVVYASPLYHYTVNSEMKAFIERTLPALEPFLISTEGRTHHPLRSQVPKIVMLSVAGFPENSVFDQLSSWTNFIFGRNSAHENLLVAEIYRSMSAALTIPYCQEKAAVVLEATRQAGREIVTSLTVAEETMARIKQSMIEDPAAFSELSNLMWQTCISEGITPKQFDEKDLVPRADSIQSYIAMMKIAFNAESADGLDAEIQFNFSGEHQGSCFFKIKDGQIAGGPGDAVQPDLTVSTPFEVWMDISAGKSDGQEMLMQQKYTVEGDLELLMQMGQLFGR